jgi:cardiolipin synthase (CMP-forming)
MRSPLISHSLLSGRRGCGTPPLAVLLLPNLLTLSRILAVPILVALLWPAEHGHEWRIGYLAAYGLYCLMGITDYFDGYLARAQGTVSKLGVFLDPIADKIMIAAVILILCATGDIGGTHIVAALVILLREIAVSGLREFLAGLRVSVPVSKLAKWKTAFQLVALGALILAGGLPEFAFIKQTGLVALWGAAVLTAITGWDYMRVGLKHIKE